MSGHEYEIPNDDGVSPADIHSGTNLTSANLSEADLRGADLSDANLSDTNLHEADLSGANLQHANLSGADLREIDLIDAKLSHADLGGANLLAANLSNANLFNANLSETYSSWDEPFEPLAGVDLGRENPWGVLFSAANLSESNLSGAELSKSDFSDADLQSANLTEANLRDTDLSVANLVGTDLRDTNLDGCELTGATLRHAYFDEVSVNGSTKCKIQNEGYDKQRPVQIPVFRHVIRMRPRWLPSVGNSGYDAQKWDSTSQAYHDLKMAIKNRGLVSKARQQHLRERGARRCEAWAAATDDGTVDEWLRWFKSAVVWQLTGYGVSIRRISRNMGILFGFATLAYLLADFCSIENGRQRGDSSISAVSVQLNFAS